MLQVRGNNGICNMRFNDANVLTVSADTEVLGNLIIDGSFVTGSMVLDDSFSSTPATSFAYFTMGGVGPQTGASLPAPILTSLAARHAVQASQFVAVSDARVKKDIDHANTQSLVESLRTLPVRTWAYKDRVQYGEGSRLGFIAQEVPDPLSKFAIAKHADFIPDIFRHATREDGTVQTYTLQNHGLKKGDGIRFCTDSTTSTATVIDVQSADKFTVDTSHGAPTIFVYGKYAADVMSIDYDAIVAALVAAYQSLEQRLASLEKK